MNYELLLYLKLAKVDVGNVSKKGENMKGFITWSIFTRWFLTELCLCMYTLSKQSYERFYVWSLLIPKKELFYTLQI